MVWTATPTSWPWLLALTAPLMMFLGASVALITISGTVWRRPRVFVSFEHELEPIANELAAALERAGLDVERLPFNTEAKHDTVIEAVRRALMRCDAMVCIPGTRPSFVESEVLVASTLQRLIIFVVSRESPRMPNTALYGYPVFVLEKIRNRDYRELASALKIGCGSWLEWWRYLYGARKPFEIFSSLRLAAMLTLLFGLLSAVSGALLAAYVTGYEAAHQFLIDYPGVVWGLIHSGKVVPLLMVIGLCTGGLLVAIGAREARNVLRQHTITGQMTFSILRRALSGTPAGRRVLVCLLREPPLAHHERDTESRSGGAV